MIINPYQPSCHYKAGIHKQLMIINPYQAFWLVVLPFPYFPEYLRFLLIDEYVWEAL